MNTKQNKILERSKIKTVLKTFLSAQTKTFFKTAEALIIEELRASSLYKNAKTVLAYAARHDEAPTDKILACCLSDNKKLALPKVHKRAKGLMDFYYIDPKLPVKEQLFFSSFGIAEPPASERIYIPENPAAYPVLVLIPGLAFSPQGGRLGKGGGYYDRYLARLLKVAQNIWGGQTNTQVSLIGLCYQVQIKENLPAETQDINVQYLLSENGLRLVDCTYYSVDTGAPYI